MLLLQKINSRLRGFVMVRHLYQGEGSLKGGEAGRSLGLIQVPQHAVRE